MSTAKEFLDMLRLPPGENTMSWIVYAIGGGSCQSSDGPKRNCKNKPKLNGFFYTRHVFLRRAMPYAAAALVTKIMFSSKGSGITR